MEGYVGWKLPMQLVIMKSVICEALQEFKI